MICDELSIDCGAVYGPDGVCCSGGFAAKHDLISGRANTAEGSD